MESFSMVQHILEIKLRVGNVKCTIQIDWKFCCDEEKIVGIWVFMSQVKCGYIWVYEQLNAPAMNCTSGDHFFTSPWGSWIPVMVYMMNPQRIQRRDFCRSRLGRVVGLVGLVVWRRKKKSWVWTVWTFGLKLLNVAYNSKIFKDFHDERWEMRAFQSPWLTW
jgi:hypothetical protein